MRVRFTLAYDGTAYGGWQVQPGLPTVQAAVESALERVTGQHSKVHGSGRTDQGVHARGQVAHADVESRMTMPTLLRALNAVLPDDIRILNCRSVTDSFHARRSAR